MIKNLWILILLAASSALAGEIDLQDIDLVRLQKALPEKWYISNIDHVNAPEGWQRSEGGSGVRIVISREPYSYDLQKDKSGSLSVWHPEFIISIMPNDFVGISAQGGTFKNGTIIARPGPRSNPGCLILGYGGSLGEGHIFFSRGSFKDWKNPSELIKQIQLKGQP